MMDDQATFDFDVVHTPEVVLVRVYYRDERHVLAPHSEVKLSVGTDFPLLYDTFRREYKWPSVQEVEQDLLKRYKGASVDRSDLTESERKAAASRDMAEFF